MSLDWRNLPSLTSLRAFDATARHGGFAGAARSLNVTHAAIAQQVRALEADLGVPLATRQGRNVQLTEAGHRLALALSDGFSTIADGVAALRSHGVVRGLRVTTTPFLTERIIVPRLSEFWHAHPGAEISLFPSREYVDILREEFDLAIRALMAGTNPGLTGIDMLHVGRASLIGIAAPSLVKEGMAAQDLPWLWHDGMAVKLDLMRSCGLDVENLKQTRIGSPNLLLEAVRQGIGATVFNEPTARKEISNGGIIEVPLPFNGAMDYFALLPKGPRHPLAMPFVEWVRKLI